MVRDRAESLFLLPQTRSSPRAHPTIWLTEGVEEVDGFSVGLWERLLLLMLLLLLQQQRLTCTLVVLGLRAYKRKEKIRCQILGKSAGYAGHPSSDPCPQELNLLRPRSGSG